MLTKYFCLSVKVNKVLMAVKNKLDSELYGCSEKLDSELADKYQTRSRKEYKVTFQKRYLWVMLSWFV